MGLFFIGLGEFLCLIAFPVGLVWLIFNFIRKRNKKKPIILILAGIIGLIVFVLAAEAFYHDEMEESRIKREQKRIEEEEQKQEELELEQDEKVFEIKKDIVEEQAIEAVDEKNSLEINDLGTAEIENNNKKEEVSENKKYKLNTFLESYNSVAEYPIDSSKMDDIKEIGRPLRRLTYTFSNGVYAIFTYNDYNKTLFIDYQEENTTDELIYPIFRDVCKTFASGISEEEITSTWEQLQSLKYSHYNGLDLNGINCSYSIQTLVNGDTKRYYVKSNFEY